MVYRRQSGNVRKGYTRRRLPARRAGRPARPRAVKRTRRAKTPCHCPEELTPAARFALAQLDPFHPQATGAKIPDSNTMPSIANLSVDQVSCPVATSNFMTGFAFRPTYNQAVINATPVDAATVSWGATVLTNAADRRDLAAIVSAFEGIRPVAHGVRVSSSLAPTSATGFVHLGLSIESAFGNAAGTWQFPTTVNQMTGLAHYKRVTLASLTQSPLTVINKWIDERAFQYEDPNQVVGIATTQSDETRNPFHWSWCFIVVLVEGAPSTSSPLSAEHILLTEALPKKTGILIGTQAAPNSPGTMSAVSSMVSDQDFGHTEANQQNFIQEGLQSFAQGAAVAGEAVYNSVATPILQRLGGHAVNMATSYAMRAVMGRGGLPGVQTPNRLSIGR